MPYVYYIHAPDISTECNYRNGMVWVDYGMPYVYYIHIPDIIAPM